MLHIGITLQVSMQKLIALYAVHFDCVKIYNKE